MIEQTVNDLTMIIGTRPACRALGSERGTARLGWSERGGGYAAVVDADAADAVEVPVERIDDLALPPRVSFMKVDVEGFEFEVLRGARALIARDRPSIFGEFNAAWLRMRGVDLAAELTWIVALGYDVLEVQEHRSARWRPKDVAHLRRREPPFTSAGEHLLLLPRPLPAAARATTVGGTTPSA